MGDAVALAAHVISYEVVSSEPGGMMPLASIDLDNDGGAMLTDTVPSDAALDGRMYLRVSLVEVSDPSYPEVGYDFYAGVLLP